MILKLGISIWFIAPAGFLKWKTGKKNHMGNSVRMSRVGSYNGTIAT
jgi:hypothetical protein